MLVIAALLNSRFGIFFSHFLRDNKYDAVVPSYPQSYADIKQQKYLNATTTATERESIAFLILTGRFIGFCQALDDSW